MRRVRFDISYDGRNYRGSQSQPGVPTIQDSLEAALQTVRAYSGRTSFAGRTDAGVHALGQVVSCDVNWDRELERLSHGLNSVLPPDIRVMRCCETAPEFNARFDARAREYRYRLVTDHLVSPLLNGYVWAYRDSIDSKRAESAARMFEGTHGFGSFASAGISQRSDVNDLIRTVHRCVWKKLAQDWLPVRDNGEIFELRIRADGFLPQMVRNIVAAIAEVGSGKQPPEWIEYLLVSGDRRLLGPPAPAHGLVLWTVDYAGVPDTDTGSTS